MTLINIKLSGGQARLMMRFDNGVIDVLKPAGPSVQPKVGHWGLPVPAVYNRGMLFQ